MGIDCSTNSLAFAIFRTGGRSGWGEDEFEGSDIYARLV